ncbi:hypothetical protein [Agarilytica rhodophyticola]|nr:hypothetical protein [Agarilytica rhodophyticola]
MGRRSEAEERINNVYREEATSLSLSRLGMADLPESLWTLTELT